MGLERFRNSRAADYSRGMRQRLTIARAFLHEPDILLLDEPWTALDDRATQLLSSLVAEAKAAGKTVVICSHQLPEAIGVADAIALLHRGRVAYRGLIDAELRARAAVLVRAAPMRGFLAQTWTVARKDLRCEFRDRQVLNAAISFALVVLLMFSFTFDPNTNVEVRSLSGGLLWVVYLFAGSARA